MSVNTPTVLIYSSDYQSTHTVQMLQVHPHILQEDFVVHTVNHFGILTLAGTTRLSYNVMCCIVMWAPSSALVRSLLNSIHPLGMGINPLKMA